MTRAEKVATSLLAFVVVQWLVVIASAIKELLT
jgi:hypothetical protein